MQPHEFHGQRQGAFRAIGVGAFFCDRGRRHGIGPWSGEIGVAYDWLCATRRGATPNHDVWALRSAWDAINPQLTSRLVAGGYRFSTVRAVPTADGGTLECLESQDAVVHKAAPKALEGQLLPRLSRRCFHLRDRGGLKQAVQQARHLVAGSRYPFVARSDARGYYAQVLQTLGL